MQLPPCPTCGAELHARFSYEAKKIGTFSIAGHQPKVVASSGIWLVCDSCGFKEEGNPTR